MRVVGLLLCLAVGSAHASSPDAGVRLFDDPLYATCPDAPPMVVLDGGWTLVPPERNARNACFMATCEADRRQKKAELDNASTLQGWTVATVAVVTVAIVAFALGRATK
jgi:hypothetical protein